MNSEYRQFYADLYPHFADGGWRELYQTYGDVWWDYKLETEPFRDTTWSGRIGLVVTPNNPRFFLELRVGDYPTIVFNADLTSDPYSASIQDILDGALIIIRKQLPSLVQEYKVKHREWVVS